MDEFYRVLFSTTEIYKLCENGHLYKLDGVFDEWIDVSDEISFCCEWEQISLKTVNLTRLAFYIEYFRYSINHTLEELGDIDITKPGDTFSFYKLNDVVAAKDNNGTEYICCPDNMIYADSKIITDEWEPLEKWRVLEEINTENDYINLKDMELYLDENGEIEGFTTDLKQFRLSNFTGEINEVYENLGIEDYWEPCKFEDIEDKVKTKQIGIGRFLLPKLNKLNEYIKKSRETNKELKIGKDFKYFVNSFEKIYALDDLGNEFLCTKNFLKPVKKGTIDGFWESESRLYVLEDLERYYSKKQKENSTNINILDLDLYVNQDEILCGVTKDGKKYIMNLYTGEFEKNTADPDTEKSLGPISPRRDGVKIQAELRYICKLDKYLDFCEDKAVKTGNKAFGEFRKFYMTKSDTGIEYYAIDDKKQEYRCFYDYIEPVKRGTIKASFYELDYRYVLKLLEHEKNNKSKENK